MFKRERGEIYIISVTDRQIRAMMLLLQSMIER